MFKKTLLFLIMIFLSNNGIAAPAKIILNAVENEDPYVTIDKALRGNVSSASSFDSTESCENDGGGHLTVPTLPDTFLNKPVLLFTLHTNTDKDCNSENQGRLERARHEMKIPRPNLGQEKNSQVITKNKTSHWKFNFKLPADFELPPETSDIKENKVVYFLHILQAKPREVRNLDPKIKADNNAKLNPRLRLSLSRDAKEGRDLLKLKLNYEDDNGTFRTIYEEWLHDFLNTDDTIRDLRGIWLQGELIAKWSNNGFVEFKLSEVLPKNKLKQLGFIRKSELDLWNDYSNLWAEVYFKAGLYMSRVQEAKNKDGSIVYKTITPDHIQIYFSDIILDQK